MSEVIYPTSGGYVNISTNSQYSGTPKAVSGVYRALYVMPSLKNYADATGMKLHVFVTSAPAPTSSLVGHVLTVKAGSSATSMTSSTAVSNRLTAAVTTTTELVFDWSAHIATITGFSIPRVHIESNVSSSETYFTTYNASSNRPYIEIETASGTAMYYCTGGVWTPCEAYYGANGVWQQCEAAYGTGGVWKELGE